MNAIGAYLPPLRHGGSRRMFGCFHGSSPGVAAARKVEPGRRSAPISHDVMLELLNHESLLQDDVFHQEGRLHIVTDYCVTIVRDGQSRYGLPVALTLPPERQGQLDTLLAMQARSREGSLVALSEVVHPNTAERDRTSVTRTCRP
jgi:hypothetical protein